MDAASLLWFLLPVAAGLGWIGGRRRTIAAFDADWRYAQRFHRRLRDLLADADRDHGELFVDLSDTERDAIDTELAIGALFRRRGEVDKAIRLHERLLGRTERFPAERAAVQMELARDYDAAGLDERAEQQYEALTRVAEGATDALEQLLRRRERDRDWHGAIAIANRLASTGGDSMAARIAHYECELADDAAARGDAEQTQRHLQRAVGACAGCARPQIMLAQRALDEARPDDALEHFAAVASRRPELMPEIIDRQLEALHRLGDESALECFVDEVRARRNAYSVIRTVRDEIATREGIEAADRFFKDQILMRPSLKGLRDWTRDQLELAKESERDKVRVILALLDQVTRDRPSHRCASCGFEGRELHWRCPSCGRWDTVHPIIGAEGE